MKRSAPAPVLALLLLVLAALPTVAQRPLPPDVRSRFLPEALRTLEEAGFGNIRVARQIMDDMPPDVVIWQYPLPPDPSVDAVARRIDPATEITLIVVEGLPVVPDLTGWRVDHAVEHVAVLGVEARLRGAGGDPTRSVVVGQEPPGPARVLPPAAVALEAGPMPRDTVLLTIADAAEASAARSGKVRLVDHELESQWELAPRLHGRTLAGPRLLVGLTLGFDAGTVEVRDARFVALETAALRYRGSLRVKDAPEELAGVGPGRLEVPGGRFDFGDGWAIAPWRSTRRAPRMA